MKSSTATRGRRPGPSDTRARILAVAHRRFLDEDYQQVTLRSIADEATVDLALISYYFGSKRGLFGAVLDLTVNPADILVHHLDGDLTTLPQRLLRALVVTWDDPDRGLPLQIALRATATDPAVAAAVSGALQREAINRIAERLSGPQATARAAAFCSQIAGLVFSRYILAVEPVASMNVDEIVRHLSPGLHAALFIPGRPLRF